MAMLLLIIVPVFVFSQGYTPIPGGVKVKLNNSQAIEVAVAGRSSFRISG